MYCELIFSLYQIYYQETVPHKSVFRMKQGRKPEIKNERSKRYNLKVEPISFSFWHFPISLEAHHTFVYPLSRSSAQIMEFSFDIVYSMTARSYVSLQQKQI